MTNIAPTAPRSDGSTRAQHVAVGVLAGSLLLLGLYTLWHFLSALAWAGIFAIALWPLYRRAGKQLGTGRHNVLLPTVFTLAVALIFIVPLGLVGTQLAREIHAATEWVRNAQENGIAEPNVLRQLPFGQTQVDNWWRQNLANPGSPRELVQRTTQGYVADVSKVIGEQIARRLTLFLFTLLTLFFLFKEGHSLTRQMRRAAARAFGAHGERIGQQIIASIHGTVNGLVLVGLGEGLLLGIVYALAGVPHPTVFGTLTALAATVPFAAPVVFALAALLLAVQGSVIWAVVVLGTGFVVTFSADHFIRPVLIGGTTKLPFIWVLLGILGGIEVWGLLGLFLGPAIMAALILLWREWASEPPPVPEV
ncbi:MAG TPA: AI-2E family transporter [Frateuria sp.]|uniref:AI-2E family transporter n=1 Tax=Frateuria sp. TaxID=2211372 RepID=UPI002D7F5A32|nr:AI-2E family transporter [Frateuria sp.]HET6806405.1 AI-2E family transporter [Frateuria sp.]